MSVTDIKNSPGLPGVTSAHTDDRVEQQPTVKELAMISMRVPVLVLALWMGLPPVSLAQKPSQSIADLTRRSHYVFSGKVDKLGASNVGLLKASPSTAVVQLRELLRGSKTLDLAGRSVTVQLRSPNEVRVGDELIFFSDVMYYGENLALRELGHVPARDLAGLRKQMEAALAAQADDELRQRLAGAQLVVVGTVGHVAPAKTRRQPISFHDPQLAQAPLKVEARLKGESGDEVMVFFPRAADPFWSRAPRLKEGESGIFLLRPNPNKRLPTGGLTALDPLDVQPRSALDRVKRLLGK